jgi:hypothetical protein
MNNVNDPSVRHARCTFCGGKGPDLQAETVTSPVTGAHYRVPLSHTSCKESILSLSLFLSLSLDDKENANDHHLSQIGR